MPCATQNEISAESAKALIANGCFAVFEGSNMPCTPDAINAIKAAGLLYSPSKASNAGGVAVSGLEMSQNSERLSWSFEEVDAQLKNIMENIYHSCAAAAAKYGMSGDIQAGANIASFLKVADAMLWQGVSSNTLFSFPPHFPCRGGGAKGNVRHFSPCSYIHLS